MVRLGSVRLKTSFSLVSALAFSYLCFTKIVRLGRVRLKTSFSFASALAFVYLCSRKTCRPGRPAVLYLIIYIYDMRFVSWNVNGLRACLEKGFRESFGQLDADVVCLQETKVQAGQVDLQFEGYESFWNYAEKKGYSGTAVFTRRRPLNVIYGLGLPEHDREGRVITLDFGDFYLITVYTPNSQDGLRRLDYRMAWDDAFRTYMQRLDAEKPVVVCGDLNVAHQEIDLKNPKSNRRNAGFTDEERGKFSDLLAAGFVDTFRHFYPTQEGIYSWWSYRFRAREKNAGWRIDYLLASERLVPHMTGASIHTEIYGSDHCPVEVDFDF